MALAAKATIVAGSIAPGSPSADLVVGLKSERFEEVVPHPAGGSLVTVFDAKTGTFVDRHVVEDLDTILARLNA
jgi:hypothetical protein